MTQSKNFINRRSFLKSLHLPAADDDKFYLVVEFKLAGKAMILIPNNGLK